MLFNLSPEADGGNLFDQALQRGRLKCWLARLTRTSRQMCRLIRRSEGYDAGTQTVEIARIHGSVARAEDFDCEFYPLKPHLRERWSQLAKAFQRGEAIPPVDLVQVGMDYYVVDGHHRVSVARMLQQAYIDARVTVAG
jgi:hypothetical protein